MRILMLLENDYVRDYRVKKEVATLSENGHNVIVAGITESGNPVREEREECTLYLKRISPFIKKTSIGALKFSFYFNFWRKYVGEILKSEDIDAIHIHDLPLSVIGIELKRSRNIKLVVDLHENWAALLSVSMHIKTLAGRLLSSDKEWRDYEKNVVSQADAVITVVEEMKARICKTGCNPEKIIILENTPDAKSETIKYERDPSFVTLFYLGGISYHRGLQYMIDGLPLVLPELPVRLFIGGDGKYRKILEAKVAELHLQEAVKFLGHLTKIEAAALMKKSDIGLIPHIRSEQSDCSSPNKLYDYMAEGLPVLASDCISIKRVIDETRSGLTYTFDSPSDFAAKLKELYEEISKSDSFSRNGISAVQAKYNWQRSSIELVDLYSRLSALKYA